MLKDSHFWTFQAGTNVRAADGRQVGVVAAVRPDAVLIDGGNRATVWTPRSNVGAYDNTGILLEVVPRELELWTSRATAPHATWRKHQSPLAWMTATTRFDA